MKSWLKDQRGMTLVELLVGIIITTIAMGVVGGIFLTTTDFFTKYATEKDAQMVVDTIYDHFSDTILYATDLYLSDTEATPTGWADSGTQYIGFDLYDNDGKVIETDNNDVYGTEFYINGRIKVVLSYVNDASHKRLRVVLNYFDVDGESVYTREREVELVNLSKFGTNIRGSGSLDNSSRKIYVYYRKDEKEPTTHVSSEEEKVWQVMNRIFTDKVATDPDFYSSLKKNVKVEGTTRNVSNPHAYLGWQYRYDSEGGQWTSSSSGDEWFLIINKERLEKMGVGKLYDEIPRIANELYMVPYHFVANTEECDLLLYVYGTTYFDNEQSGYSRETRLIYLQEENAWYYYKTNETIGQKGKCLSLKVGNTSKTGFPVYTGAKIVYQDEESEKTDVIVSSYQIKQFFKKYGQKVG